MKQLFTFPFKLMLGIIYIAGFSTMLQAQDYKFEQTSVGMVVMEAENFSELVIPPDSETRWDTVSSPEGASGGFAMEAAPPDGPSYASADDALAEGSGSAYLSFAINFSQPSNSYIWARASRVGDGGSDSYHVGIDGDIPSTGAFINFENSVGGTEGEPDSTQWVWINTSGEAGGPAFVEINEEGVHNINVYIRETVFKIDKVILTNNPNFTPEGEGPEQTLATSGDITYTNIHKNDELQLSNAPNPFSGSTDVSVTLSRPGKVSLKVYNTYGREIADLFEGKLPEGKRTVTWKPGRELASGVYFIKLKTSESEITEKAVFVK